MARRKPDAPPSPRASLRRRVDVALASPPTWEPLPEQRAAIEQVWLPKGGSIPAPAWEAIHNAVDLYLQEEAFARAAADAGDTKAKLEALRKGATAFVAALDDFGRGAVTSEARSRLNAFLVVADGDDPHLVACGATPMP